MEQVHLCFLIFWDAYLWVTGTIVHVIHENLATTNSTVINLIFQLSLSTLVVL